VGRHVWARVFFVASSGNVTDEVIRKPIETQDMPKPDDDFTEFQIKNDLKCAIATLCNA